MARFVVRRVMAMIVVLFLISVLTFLLFEAIPNGDPALRLAGALECRVVDLVKVFDKGSR